MEKKRQSKKEYKNLNSFTGKKIYQRIMCQSISRTAMEGIFGQVS